MEHNINPPPHSLFSSKQIICTGQRYNHELISSKVPSALSQRGSINVRPTLQVDADGWDNIFAIGDVANTKAIKAGHTGYYQANTAANNIVKLVERDLKRKRKEIDGCTMDDEEAQKEKKKKDDEEEEEEEVVLESYVATEPRIKITTGKVSQKLFFFTFLLGNA